MRERWTPSRARSNRDSATKSRSLTASSELSNTAAKPRSAAVPSGSSGERRAGEGAGAERRDVGPDAGGEQPVDVAGQRPAVGQEVVGQQHGLGPLQVRVAGEVGVAGRLGPGEQRPLEREHRRGHLGQRPLRVEPQVGGDLVVAAAAGVELAAGRAGQLGDAPLDRGVDVLVGRARTRTCPSASSLLDLVERAEDRPTPRRRRGCSAAHQAPDVGPRPGDVVGREALVVRAGRRCRPAAARPVRRRSGRATASCRRRR